MSLVKIYEAAIKPSPLSRHVTDEHPKLSLLFGRATEEMYIKKYKYLKFNVPKANSWLAKSFIERRERLYRTRGEMLRKCVARVGRRLNRDGGLFVLSSF